MLTTAERDQFPFFKVDLDRSEIRSRMRAVAERLRFGSAATTPVDGTRSNFQHIGTALRNDDLISHASSSLLRTPVVSVTQPIDTGAAAPVLQ